MSPAGRNPERVDVAIVGAGPTGVTLARMLGLRGVRVALLERHVGVLPMPRAVHIDGETLRMFDLAGLARPLMKVLRPGGAMHWVNAEGRTLLVRKGVEGLGPHGWHANLYFHQPDLERVLRSSLQALAGVSLVEGTTVVGIRQDPDGVCVDLQPTAAQAGAEAAPRTGAHADALRARYVVGCDGTRSTVRAAFGDTALMAPLGAPQAWVVADLLLNRPLHLPEHSVQHCDPSRPATAVFVNALRRRWELMLLPGEDPAEMTQAARVWSLLSRWVKPTQAALERAVVYTFDARVARRWQHGRLLLAGDAAHQTPPFLGQGLCAGIRDAANLAWKLALAVHRPAVGEPLLATYGPERQAHAEAFVRLAVEVGDIIQERDPDRARERDERLLREGLTFQFPTPTLGSGCHRARPQAPDVGRIAPHFELADGRWSDEVAGLGWSVVVDATDQDVARIRTHANTATPRTVPPVGEDVAWVAAAGSGWQTWLRERGAKAVVLRPDRHVFDLCQDDDGLANALRAITPLVAAR
jgi:3-(3-hydroxy-phenyl)propionate hydroxylase